MDGDIDIIDSKSHQQLDNPVDCSEELVNPVDDENSNSDEELQNPSDAINVLGILVIMIMILSLNTVLTIFLDRPIAGMQQRADQSQPSLTKIQETEYAKRLDQKEEERAGVRSDKS